MLVVELRPKKIAILAMRFFFNRGKLHYNFFFLEKKILLELSD